MANKTNVHMWRPLNLGKEAAGALRKFGVDLVGAVPWGTHLCQFYKTKQDLLEILIPYFTTGVHSNEYCLWVTSSLQEEAEVKALLKQALTRFGHYVKQERMAIINFTDNSLSQSDTEMVLNTFLEQEKTALAKGFCGLRFAATAFTPPESFWNGIVKFEAALTSTLQSHKILGFCGYSTADCPSQNVVNLQCAHHGALIKTETGWGLIEDARQRKQTEAQYRNAIQISIDAFWICDVEGHFLDVNGALCNLTGYSRDELLTLSIQDLELTYSPNQVKEQTEKIRRQGHHRLETRFRRKDGLPVDIEVSASYVVTNEGGRIFVFAHNITKRCRNEEAVKHSEMQYKELANCITDSFVALDSNLCYVYWNKACEKITGIKAKDAIGHHVLEIFSGPQTQKVADAYLKVLKTRKSKVFVDEFIMNDRNIIVENYIYPTRSGVAVFTKDITQRKALQRKLVEYTQKLEDLVKVRTEKLKAAERLAAIGETAGMVGHDIRNPLQTISGELYLTKTEIENLPDGESRHNLMESINVIREQLTYINKIVADLQDFARTSLPNLEPTNLEMTINEIMETVNIPADIRVAVLVKEKFPILYSDVIYLKRILINLITNAVQAMPNGGKLTLTADFDASKAVLTVQDTGQGMPPEVKEKIFKPLFTTKAKGQGLGLAVIKKLTDALGGNIRFESEVGKGTIFIVDLPLTGTA